MPCSCTAARPLAISAPISKALSGQPADSAPQRLQILAVDVLHRKEVVTVSLAGVEDPADVGMGDLARDLQLAQQARQPVLVLLQRCGQHLERHRLVELQIIGPVHLAHTAPAEETYDAVAPRQDCAREEPAFLERSLPRRAFLAAGA